MDDAKVYEKETWYVVMAFTEQGLRYAGKTGGFTHDVRSAALHGTENAATDAAARVLTEHKMPAMAKKLTVEYSVTNVREPAPEELHGS